MKCEACGGEFAPKRKTSRFCAGADCIRDRERDRKRAQRSGKVIAFRHELQVGSVSEATRAELEAAGKLNTSMGQSALVLADQLDHGSRDTGSSKASVAGRLQVLMGELTKDVARAADPVDELRALRERRQSG